MGDNPLGKIPTLVLDDGRVLYDSIVICEYLDALAGGAKLFPRDGDARWRALRRHALADGMLDTLILWRAELAKSEARRTPEWLATFDLKIRNALDTLEADAEALERTPFDIAHVTIGVALKYIDFRFGHLGWRNGRPKCSAWILQFEQRESAAKTAFVDA
jgi:glutathione S-transferase